LAWGAPVAQAQTTPAFDWAGFYAGGHLGIVWGDANFASVTDAIFPGFLVGPPLVLVPSRFGTVPAVSARDSNLLGGGQLGFNWQSGQLVLGLEADVSVTALSGSSTFSVFTAPPGLEAGQTITGSYVTSIDWMASLRGRLGFAWNQTLIYVTGGAALAAGDVRSSFTLTNTNPNVLVPAVGASGTTVTNTSFSTIGWTIGFGIECVLGENWSLAGEYRHSDFGRRSIALASTDPSGLVGLPPLATTMRLTTDQLTLRLNRRFGTR
jgi:outer membrane immunogenic protein